MHTFKDAAHLAQSKVLDQVFEPHLLLKPREDEIPSLEGVSAERGTASWLEHNLELHFNKTRINELELEAKIADNLLSDF